MSAAQIVAEVINANDEIATLHGLAGDNLRQRVPEWIVANHGNDEWSERVREGFRRETPRTLEN